MTHPTELLSALMDGELGDAERARVEAHVAECAACADVLRELRSLDAFARGMGPAEAPAGYHEGLTASLRPRLRGERVSPARRVRPWVWPLAAALAIAVVAPIVLRQQPPLAPAAPPAAATKENAAPPPAVAPPALDREARPAENQAASRERASEAEGKSDAHGKRLDRVLATTPPIPATPARPAAAPAKPADTFAAPPPAPAYETREADRPAAEGGFVGGVVGGIVGGAPAASAPAEEASEPVAQARDERKSENARAAPTLAGRADAASSLKKAKAGPEDARRSREAWRRVVEADPDGPDADAARVRVIEAGLEAYRLGGDEADRLQARRDADAYLARADAGQAAHVREIVRRLREDGRR